MIPKISIKKEAVSVTDADRVIFFVLKMSDEIPPDKAADTTSVTSDAIGNAESGSDSAFKITEDTSAVTKKVKM